ncbi:MAG: flagellar hook-basal body protein, partial [Epsilonproteobacteria bacterium]|nr:flagellar hook-basal body protein [Campylobacterota bacterium]
MQNGYYQAVGGMVAQFNRLDTISNNLANANTSAFKRDDVVIGDFLSILKNQRDELPIKDNTKDAAKFLNRSLDRVPHVVRNYTDFSLGGMKKTDNPLDIAMTRSDRFFLVQTPSGIKMTQDGTFTLNEKGELVTKEGFKVLGENYFKNKQPITIPPNSTVTVSKDGTIYADNESVGKLFIAKYNNNLSNLKKDGDNLYNIEDMNDITLSEGGDYVAQGFIQTSNINPVKEMVALIETNRLVEMYQKVMTTQMNDLNSDAINKLAS